jgi:GrpB-like predicted nucleotidyltransferase (UPF0157 family)
MLGLEKGLVRLVEYTPEWKECFELEKTALQASLGSIVLEIQHVGSTSIPGMISKPIVDIAIAVNDFEEAKACIPLIERLGYEYRGELGIPRRHYFTKGNPRLFHIHINEIESREWQDQLLFRDYLRRNRGLAEEYAELKRQLALQYPHDRGAYLDGKADFIQRVIQLARLRA